MEKKRDIGHWDSDKRFRVEDWRAEVADDFTRLGYWAWVKDQAGLVSEDKPGNARFWVYSCCDNSGWVKLTLKPNQKLKYYRWRAHEEGWSSVFESWEHLGDCVERVCITNERDCDGPHERHHVDRCDLEKLSWFGYNHDGVMRPLWIEIESGQRDYFAEAAGY